MSTAGVADFDFVREMYIQFRDAIKHEDSLINVRMTWCIAITTVMFAAVAAITVQAPPDVFFPKLGLRLPGYSLWIVAISLSGIVTTYVSAYGIRAAEDSIGAMKVHWCKILREMAKDDDRAFVMANFPGITQGVPLTEDMINRILSDSEADTKFRKLMLGMPFGFNRMDWHYPSVFVLFIMLQWLLLLFLGLVTWPF
jgi:hypothetical protein